MRRSVKEAVVGKEGASKWVLKSPQIMSSDGLEFIKLTRDVKSE